MKPAWTILTGDDQVGPATRHILDHTPERNAERHRLEAARRPAFKGHSFDKWIFPIIENTPSARLLDDLVSVQPLAAPAASTLKMEILPPGEFARRERELEESLRADLKPGEVLREFDDIGPLSGTAGYFVSPADDLNRVLRYVVTMMS